MPIDPNDLSKLKAVLQTSGLSQKNQPLHQVIWGLIEFCQSKFQAQAADIGNAASGGSSGLVNKTYATVNNETGSLPNSRQVTAGTDISLDITTPAQLIINAYGGPGTGYWAVLSDGDPDEPELIFADGEVISMFIPL